MSATSNQLKAAPENTPYPEPKKSGPLELGHLETGKFHTAGLLNNLAFCCVCLFAVFLCFTNLDNYSIRDWDESLHVLAVQNMYQNNDWLTPTVEGKNYFSKPPLKMWLSAASLYFFGQSNYAWRFFDALAGVGTTIVVYFFSLQLFRSRFAALIASLSLLSCRGFLFEHSVRMGVQDSAMVFFSTAALFTSWRAFGFSDNDHGASSSYRSIRLYSLLTALFCAGAILTKSVQGLFPLCVIAATCALSKGLSLRILLRLMAVSTLSVSIAALYMLPHCLLTPNACATFFGVEVWQRVTQGYHNTDNPWLYWELLVKRSYSVSPVLLFAAFAFACTQLLSSVYKSLKLGTRIDTRFLFLLVWIVPPAILLSLSASRLPWYINPLYPGIALLLSGLFAFASKSVTKGAYLSRACSTIVCLGIIGSLLSFSLHHALAVTGPKQRIAFDLLREELRPIQDSLAVRTFNMPKAAQRELPYLRTLLPYANSSTARIAQPITPKDNDSDTLILTSKKDLPDFLALDLPEYYMRLPRFAERKTPIIALLYQANSSKPLGSNVLSASKSIIRFGKKDAPIAFGWGHAGSFGKLGIRNSSAKRSGVLFDADWLFSSRETRAFLNIAARSSANNLDNKKLKIFINEKEIAELNLERNTLKTYEFTIPAGSYNQGTNLITFLSGEHTRLMANWLSIQLR